MLAAGLVVVGVLGYRVLSKNRTLAAEAQVTAALAEPTATVAPAESAIAEPAPAATTPASSESEPAPPAAAASAVAQPVAAAAAASTGAAALPAPAVEIRKVTVKSKPPKVRFFHFGKLVGVTPFVLEFKPGERHAYEAGLPGYGTRKVVIDGSKPQVVVGLTRDKP